MLEQPFLPKGYEFHHIGYATASVEREKRLFSVLGYRMEGEAFTDKRQGVAGCFMVGPGPRIELLENLPGANTLTPWLDAGARMYHLAYWVDSLTEALEWTGNQRARVIVRPVPALAFGGRHIAFVMFRSGLMLEFIQREFKFKQGGDTPSLGSCTSKRGE